MKYIDIVYCIVILLIILLPDINYLLPLTHVHIHDLRVNTKCFEVYLYSKGCVMIVFGV